MHRHTIAKRFGASAGVTALLATAAVGLAPSGAVAQQYPPAPGSPSPISSPQFPGVGSPDPSATASPSVSASPSATGSPSATVEPSASPTRPGSQPPTPPGCARAAEVALDRTDIIATGSALVTVTATPNSTVDLFAYTRPSTSYRVVRSAELGDSGVAQFRIVPPANTRLYAQQRGCAIGQSKVLNVRTAMSIFAVRNGVRDYTFSGRTLPARPGGLIVSLYRVTPGGQQILTSQTRASASDGRWVINRKFTGSGRFGFVARTGQDLQNAPGSSNVRMTVIH
jgi:hypothetical protein